MVLVRSQTHHHRHACVAQKFVQILPGYSATKMETSALTVSFQCAKLPMARQKMRTIAPADQVNVAPPLQGCFAWRRQINVAKQHSALTQ